MESKHQLQGLSSGCVWCFQLSQKWTFLFLLWFSGVAVGRMARGFLFPLSFVCNCLEHPGVVVEVMWVLFPANLPLLESRKWGREEATGQMCGYLVRGEGWPNPFPQNFYFSHTAPPSFPPTLLAQLPAFTIQLNSWKDQDCRTETLKLTKAGIWRQPDLPIYLPRSTDQPTLLYMCVINHASNYISLCLLPRVGLHVSPTLSLLYIPNSFPFTLLPQTCLGFLEEGRRTKT